MTILTRSWRDRLESQQSRVLALILIAVLMAVEICAGVLAHETMGWSFSALLLMAAFLNVPFGLLALWRPLDAVVLPLVGALLIVPWQIRLGWRLVEVEREVAEIAGWAYEARKAEGLFPEDLGEYEPKRVGAMHFITGYSRRGGPESFAVSYFIGSRTTSHWYSSEGGWGYYDD